MELYEYADAPTHNQTDVQNIINNIGVQTKYEVSLVNANTQSYVTLKENGDIEMFADHMLGIRLDRSKHSINMSATSTNITGDMSVSSHNGKASFSVTADDNNSYLSQKAAYIGINSSVETDIGSMIKATGSKVFLTADTVEIDANKFIINGTEYTSK